MRNLGEGAWIGGKSWLYLYYDAGELVFKRLPADEVLPFWADADHTILDAAVHVYAVEEYDESEILKSRDKSRGAAWWRGWIVSSGTMTGPWSLIAVLGPGTISRPQTRKPGNSVDITGNGYL